MSSKSERSLHDNCGPSSESGRSPDGVCDLTVDRDSRCSMSITRFLNPSARCSTSMARLLNMDAPFESRRSLYDPHPYRLQCVRNTVTVRYTVAGDSDICSWLSFKAQPTVTGDSTARTSILCSTMRDHCRYGYVFFLHSTSNNSEGRKKSKMHSK